MGVVVIEAPKPIVTPADIPGEHAGDDAFLVAMIAAAQAEIDGPTGNLGRALGEQTLELRTDAWPCRLPYRPVIEVESVTVGGDSVEDVTAEQDGTLVTASRIGSGPVVIRYRAGYDNTAVDEGGTGAVPANAKAAVILASKLLLSSSEGDVFTQQESVDGIGSTSRNVSPYISQAIQNAVGNLLAPLRVWA